MQQVQSSQDIVIYQILIHGLPARIQSLPEHLNWLLLKDELRTLIWKNKESEKIKEKSKGRGEKSRITSTDKLRIRKDVIADKSLEPPRISVQNGLAWMEFQDKGKALAMYRIVQGHVWKEEQAVLNAWLFEQVGNRLNPNPIRAPLDSMTQLPMPAPIPRGLGRSSVPLRMHANDRSQIPIPNVRQGNSVTMIEALGSQNMRENKQALADLPGHFIRYDRGFQSGHIVDAIQAQQMQNGNTSEPSTPPLTASSRSSSISTSLSRATTSADISSYIPMPPPRSVPILISTPWTSRQSSVSSTMTMDSAANTHAKPQNSSPILDDCSTQSNNSSSVPIKRNKVVIKNLSSDSTEQTVYDLVERNTRMYVPLVQPHPVRLRKVNKQSHAYITFIERSDAEKAIQQLHGLLYMDKRLQVTLE